MTYLRVLFAEVRKLKRSRITWVLTIIYGLAPLMLGLMMSVLKNPDLGRRMGLLTTKAQLTIGATDWPTYLGMTGFLFAGGMIVISIVVAFVFGREYVEGTAKNMLTLPVGRSTIVAAKLTVCAIWFVGMASVVYVEALLIGQLIDLPGYSPGLLQTNVRLVAKLVFQVLLLSSIAAWITVGTRGYLAPVGISILLLLIGDLFAHTGWGLWVPWSIVLLTSGAGSAVPGPASTVVLIVSFAVGALATYLTFERTDNTQ
jgi:ABC-2 type transport system permease protein